MKFCLSCGSGVERSVQCAQGGQLKKATIFDEERDKNFALSELRILTLTFIICLIKRGASCFASGQSGQNSPNATASLQELSESHFHSNSNVRRVKSIFFLEFNSNFKISEILDCLCYRLPCCCCYAVVFIVSLYSF